MRAALPLVIPTALIGASFGVAATTSGWGTVAPIVMSAIVFSGAAQFASLAVLSAGGSVITAIVAATLVASRFLAIGVALGPSMRGGKVRRAIEGQAVVDASLILAKTGEARYGVKRLLGVDAAAVRGLDARDASWAWWRARASPTRRRSGSTRCSPPSSSCWCGPS